MDMIERVARAISEVDCLPLGPAHARAMARAAIEAMREPTTAMIDATQDIYAEPGRHLIEYVWEKMIDAALNETAADSGPDRDACREGSEASSPRGSEPSSTPSSSSVKNWAPDNSQSVHWAE